MSDLTNIDKQFPDCTAINTEAWLKAVLGDEVEIGTEEFREDLSNHWLVRLEDEILATLTDETGLEYKCTELDNVYNNDNDFSSVFQWQVFYPEDESDWYYAHDVYVAIEVHLGGDVRGNYGRVRLYRADCLAEAGFLDWVIGWDVRYSNGDEVPENDCFSIGYSNHPYYQMEQHLKSPLKWSEKRQCFVGVYEDGRFVECRPYLNVA